MGDVYPVVKAAAIQACPIFLEREATTEKACRYTDGTMYNTQITIGPDGKYLGKHQKVMPTVGERYVHALGGADTYFAQVAKCFVISACATVNEDMIKKLQLTPEEEEILRQPQYAGGSMIAAPNGTLIAGPMGNEEGILYADLDLELCAKHKLEYHFSGHYNRPDMFQLSINRQTPKLYSAAKEQSNAAKAVDDIEAGEQKNKTNGVD